MDPSAAPTESTGTASYAMTLGGRYLESTAKGTFSGIRFEGKGVTAYDNVTRQFAASWIDNFGTRIMHMTGTYDPATRSLTFFTDMDDPMKPGTKIKVREVLRLVDAKTMEIVYTRTK